MLASCLITLLVLPMLCAAEGTHYRYITEPEQIHLAYGRTPETMRVSWVTARLAPGSVVEYGTTRSNLAARTAASTKTFYTRNMQLHTALMRVEPGVEYFYRVGCELHGWSGVFVFRAKRRDNDAAWRATACIFGDMGYEGNEILPLVQTRAQSGKMDAIFHNGDMAYDMYVDDAKIGDLFMRQIQPAAAYVPYMTTVGNHEAYDNYINYRIRFNMPFDEDGTNMFYSFNFGRAKILMLDSEVYYDAGHPEIQEAWLKQELKLANSLAERQERPWIVALAHHPMYCNKCPNNLPMRMNLEKLMYDNGVDLMIWAHWHNYERTYPMYNFTLPKPINPRDRYFNPGAPVHIISGAAGAGPDHLNGFGKRLPYEAFVNMNYTFTHMEVQAKSISLVQLTYANEVLDKVTLRKTWPNGRPTWLQPKFAVVPEGSEQF